MSQVICEKVITSGCNKIDCDHIKPHTISNEVYENPKHIPFDMKQLEGDCTQYIKCYGDNTVRCVAMVEIYNKKKERK